MMQIAVACPDAFIVAGELVKTAAKVSATTDAITVHFGQLLKTRIQAKASGRPGPNAPTGDYRRSWTITKSSGGVSGGTVVEVGTNKPQGRRLEYGFVGADSLGRVYDQPPYPHVGPARDEIEPEFVGAIEAHLGRLL